METRRRLMWPFTKKTETIKTEEKAKEKNFKLEYARDQINAELTKFYNKLRDKNLTEENVGLWFTTHDVNTKFQVCEITALVKTESKVIGEILQKVVNHPNYKVNLFSPKLSHWPSFYDAVKTIMNKGTYGIGVDKQWFKISIETNDTTDISEFIDGISYFARACINRFNNTSDLDFFKEMEDLRMSDSIDIGSSEIWLKLNPVKAAQYLDAIRIKYKDHDKKYLDLYEDYVANRFANEIREKNRHNSYTTSYKCTTLQPEINIFPRDMFTAQFKEITEEEKRQKICGEFVKKVNNMV